MTLHHVTCHVTAMSCASSSLIKEKEIQKKRNIKSRKLDKRKRKMLVSKVFHNNCPSKQKWLIYFLVVKDSREFDLTPIFPSKLL